MIKNNIVTVPHTEGILSSPRSWTHLRLFSFCPCIVCSFLLLNVTSLGLRNYLGWGLCFKAFLCLSMVCCSLLFSWVIFGEITSDYTEIGIKLQWACVLQSWGLSGCLCNFSRHIKCYFWLQAPSLCVFYCFPFPLCSSYRRKNVKFSSLLVL